MSLPTLKISRSLAGRVVHLQIIPRPVNIAESREVFKILSSFGELQYYKSQRFNAEPNFNGAIVIFKEEKAAREVIQMSPIRFRMGIEQEKKHAPRSPLMDTGPVQSAQVQTAAMNDLPAAPAQRPILPFEEPQEPLSDTVSYQIIANPAAMDPTKQVAMDPYHGGFKLQTDTVPYEDLHRRVPHKGMAVLGWKTRQKPMRDVLKAREKDQYGAYPAVPLAKYYQEYLASRSAQDEQAD